MAATPRTPSTNATPTSNRPQGAVYSWSGGPSNTRTPTSATSSTNTYLLPTSPMKNRRLSSDHSYRPSIVRTVGQRPACLVNATVTYCGNNQLYAFGGFDQYTDEVYNHVLKLDLNTLQWSLVDNYGDIPGVRMGHTACLWQGDKILIHGGENEHRDYLSDVVIFDLKTSTWTSPDTSGPTPRGRARHAAVVHDDKLFVLGGLTGTESHTIDEICYLDLKTWTWSRSWSFVPRFDHTAWVWAGRMWVFGGLGPDMERAGELWWLDLKSSPAFKNAPEFGSTSSHASTRRPSPARGNSPHLNQSQAIGGGTTSYAANSSSIQVRTALHNPRPVAPGAICSMKFVSGPNVPIQSVGSHFHAYSSGTLLDFVTPATSVRPSECNLSALELDNLQWQKLAEGQEIFDPGYRWSYCALNEDGTKAWLLGCANDTPEGGTGTFEEFLSDILPLDLRRYGLLGRDASADLRVGLGKLPASDRHASSDLTSLGVDLASIFDQSPESGGSADFVVIAERDEDLEDAQDTSDGLLSPTEDDQTGSSRSTTAAESKSPPIHVHKLILQARWPHFSRVYSAQMAEFHTKKMHIPEPYSVIRAFLYYLYTDSIARHERYCLGLWEVAGMLVLANIYDMPRLRLLCIHRLSRELDVESAAFVWERACVAGEEWLKRRAANFCLTHWGRIVRTEGFRRLSRQSMADLCEVVDLEGRVVGGEELELVGGLGGGKFGFGGSASNSFSKVRSFTIAPTNDEVDEFEAEDDDAMIETN